MSSNSGKANTPGQSHKPSSSASAPKQPPIASTQGEPSHTNDFWRIKITYYFNEILDCNDDGKVNADDIKIIINFYRDIKRLSEKGSRYNNFKNFIEKWQSNLFAGRESVTDAEFHKYCEGLRTHLLSKKEWPSDMRNYIDALFNILDDDMDGWINLKDFLSIATSDEDKNCRNESWKLLSGSASTDHFKLSKDSFDKLCKEFLTSTDPKTVGNCIFGTFDYRTYEKNKEKEREAKEKLLKEMKQKEREILEKSLKANSESKISQPSKENEKLNSTEKNALR